MKSACKITIQGTVQSIFYSQFVKENATKNGLSGYFRNLENGNAEILVEGDDFNINPFLEIIKKGPKHAQIRNITFENKKWSGEFKEFKILKF